MITVALPPPVMQVMPLLKALDTEQKMMVVKALLFDSGEQVAELPKHDENLAWEMGKDIFGSYHSGRADLSQNAKALVKEKIRAKHG